tara:strand:- start:1150 stop:1383 length:234 start_codon:yes stop_codon:yes gene_type:complete
MAFKMRGYSAYTKMTDPPTMSKGDGGKHTTYDTTYYSETGEKVSNVTEEDTGKVNKDENGRRFVMHNDGRKLYIDKN